MNKINNFVRENLKINKNSKIKNELVNEISMENNKDISIQSFNYEYGKNDYDHGFFIFNTKDNIYSIVAFNKDSEEADNILVKEYDIKSKELLRQCSSIGTMTTGGSSDLRITRLW